MDFLFNRKLAAGVLAVCVLGSTFGLGGAALKRDQNAVMRVFQEGTAPEEGGMRFSVDAYLENCAKYARLMAQEYTLRTDGIANPELETLCAALTDSDAADAARLANYNALCAEVETLYTNFYAAGVSDADGADFLRAYRNYKSEAQKIGYDGYSDAARSYNKGLGGFPAGLVAGLWGADEAVTFN